MTIETKPFYAAEILNSDEPIAAYLEEAFEDGTPSVIASALGTVAPARNFSMIARDTGLTRETLYKALSAEGNPTLSTLTAVTKALGFHLSIKPNIPSAV
jgi:probable addiction module antidote protein